MTPEQELKRKRDNDAFRKRRSLMHQNNDHSICRPAFCAHARMEAENDPPVIRTPIVQTKQDENPSKEKVYEKFKSIDVLEHGMGPDAQIFWDDISKMGEINAMMRPVVIEACRIIDRLKKLDDQLRAKDGRWLRLRSKVDDDTTFIVYVDRALQEAREQSGALTRCIGELRMLLAQQRANKSKTVDDLTPKVPQGVKGLQDELSKRRNQAAH